MSEKKLTTEELLAKAKKVSPLHRLKKKPDLMKRRFTA